MLLNSVGFNKLKGQTQARRLVFTARHLCNRYRLTSLGCMLMIMPGKACLLFTATGIRMPYQGGPGPLHSVTNVRVHRQIYLGKDDQKDQLYAEETLDHNDLPKL